MPKIGHGCFAREADVASGLDRAAAAPGDEDGQVVVIVLVAVAVAAAIDQHAMIEQGAVTLGHALQSLQQIGQLRDVELIDLAHLADLLRIAPVMGNLVVTFIHAEVGVAAIARLIGKDERRDARGVGLKRSGMGRRRLN